MILIHIVIEIIGIIVIYYTIKLIYNFIKQTKNN